MNNEILNKEMERLRKENETLLRREQKRIKMEKSNAFWNDLEYSIKESFFGMIGTVGTLITIGIFIYTIFLISKVWYLYPKNIGYKIFFLN